MLPRRVGGSTVGLELGPAREAVCRESRVEAHVHDRGRSSAVVRGEDHSPADGLAHRDNPVRLSELGCAAKLGAVDVLELRGRCSGSQ